MTQSVPGDAYARISAQAGQTRTYGTPQRPDATLFVDLDTDVAKAATTLHQIRDLPYGNFIGVQRVVVRFPFDAAGSSAGQIAAATDDLTYLLGEVAPGATRCEVLEQPFGRPARLHRQGYDPEEAGEVLLRRLRAVELHSLLAYNHAIWRPDTYHFALPDGSHVKEFVRVADGLSSPRDVYALSSWLLPTARAHRGYVFDNRSLTPLALALENLYLQVGVPQGPAAFLEHYPNSQFDVEATTHVAAAAGGGVDGVLSVSSGGDTKRRLLSAFDRAAQPDWQLHVLLDRHQLADPAADPRRVSTWHAFGTTDDSHASGDRCGVCLSADASRVVAIDPRYFDGMVLPKPELMMLTPSGAVSVAQFWQTCDAAGAVAIEHLPSEGTRSRRAQAGDPSGRMGVYVALDRLLMDDGFEAVIETATRALLARNPEGRERQTPAEALTGVDLVLVAKTDATGASGAKFVALVETIAGLLPTPPPEGSIKEVDAVDDPASWDPEVISALVESKKVLIVGRAAVTGFTMQRLLIGCQEHLRQAKDPQPLTGVLLNTRMATKREYTTLRNSYGLQLYSLFNTPLPLTSPLRREAGTLSNIRRDLRLAGPTWQPHLEKFLDERSRICNGDTDRISEELEARYVPLLWGLPREDEPRAHIRQHSIFGHKLGPAAYLAAVGTAVQRQREHVAEQSGPVWHLFEMPALLRSYYDPLLIASMLRWMEPQEIWWGDAISASQAIIGLLERGPEEDLAVLVPELLLSAAHGKLPLAAAQHVSDKAESLLANPPDIFDAATRVAIGAGLLAWRGERASRLPRAEADIQELPAFQAPTSHT